MFSGSARPGDRRHDGRAFHIVAIPTHSAEADEIQERHVEQIEGTGGDFKELTASFAHVRFIAQPDEQGLLKPS